MSGSTQLSTKSEYYTLFIETPRMNFSDPNREMEYHKEKNRLFQKQLKVIKPIFDKYFEELNNDHTSHIKLTKYKKNLPEIYEESLNKNSQKLIYPCRQNIFLLPNAPIAGLLHIEIAFSEFPGSKSIQTLKHYLEKLLKTCVKGDI